jgi:hypothetical protein
MTTMMRSAIGALAAIALTVAPAGAQQSDQECRCVDADGNTIERCTCFRSPETSFRALYDNLADLSGRPRLGISIDVTQSARRDAEGAYVTDVLDGGPADEAGIRTGDVITSVDGRSLASSIGADAEEDFDLDGSIPVQRLLAITRELEPGTSVEVEYLRDGQRQTTMVEVRDLSERWGAPAVALPRWNERLRGQLRGLGEDARDWRRAPDADVGPRYLFRGGPDGPDVRVFGPSPEVLIGGLHRDGLRLAEVNPGLGAYFGTDDGVLVLDVDRGSGFGLQAGDVILRIGSREVDTPDRVRRILSSYGDDEDIDFHILRDGSETVVTGRRRY